MTTSAQIRARIELAVKEGEVTWHLRDWLLQVASRMARLEAVAEAARAVATDCYDDNLRFDLCDALSALEASGKGEA